MTADWVTKANAGWEAWKALGPDDRHELLTGVRWDTCLACSECTERRGHTVPHTCDCAEAWCAP